MLPAVIKTAVFDQVTSAVAEHFRTDVIERWTKFRSKQFFESFCEVVALELETRKESSTVDAYLRKLLSDEARSEVLFDAYRRVCFSASKTLGPKVIGILTAHLVLEDRFADEDEEKYFAVAEALSDSELRAFVVYFEAQSALSLSKPKDVKRTSDAFEVKLGSDQLDSAWSQNKTLELGSSNLEYVGRWASKMCLVGAMYERVEERLIEYRADSERHVDEDGTIREVTRYAILPLHLERLVALIDRATGPDLDGKPDKP